MAYNAFRNETVRITSAQLALQSSSPPVLVAAPGADKAHRLIGVTQYRKTGSIANNNGDLNIGYDGVSTDLLNDNLPNDEDEWLIAVLETDRLGFDRAEVVNKALVWKNGTDDPSGAALTIAVANGGSGYVNDETFLFGSGAHATGRVVSHTGGVVTAVAITVPGYGVVVGNAQETFPGSGSGTGLTIDVTAITPFNTELYLFLTFVTYALS